jgi:hypothetical protein
MYRGILDGIENHRLSSDFEELTSADEQWDDWFVAKYGCYRADGQEPVGLAEFKQDMAWILTDKLGEDLLERFHVLHLLIQVSFEGCNLFANNLILHLQVFKRIELYSPLLELRPPVQLHL